MRAAHRHPRLTGVAAAAASAALLAACGSAIQSGPVTVTSVTTPTQAPAPAPAPAAVGRGGSAVAVPAAVVALPRVITRGPASAGGRKVVYLTFDDGPSRYTRTVLRTLRPYGAKATFFVIGRQVGPNAALVRDVHAEGHGIQNHTWSHPLLPGGRATAVRIQVTRGAGAIVQAGLPSPACFRPPYGAYDDQVRRTARAAGQRVVTWSVDSRDWTRPGGYPIAQRVVGSVRPGSIVLMHDGGGDRGQTIVALRTILARLTRAGYTFAALPMCR